MPVKELSVGPEKLDLYRTNGAMTESSQPDKKEIPGFVSFSNRPGFTFFI